jgi:hypothetical protein
MQVSFKKQAGLLLLEVLAGLIILASIITGIAMMINRSSEDTQAAIAAQHLRTVGDAAAAYIRNNLPSILKRADADTPVLIKVSDLQLAKNLPDNFSSTNAYQQQTCVLVLQPDPIGKPGQVTAMVVTEGGIVEGGGPGLNEATVNTIANLVGASGGAIRNSDAANFRGSRNSWTVAIGNFNNDNIHIPNDPSLPDEPSQNCSGTSTPINKPSLSAGHPAMALWLANGGINPDVIYRKAIPGRPDLNQMQTPLDLVQREEGAACVDSSNIEIEHGFARNSSGDLLTCKDSKWIRASASGSAVLRKSNATAERPENGGKSKYFYANCNTAKGENLIIGSCSAYCHQFVPIGGGPHFNADHKAIGWKCPQSDTCITEAAKVACTRTSDSPGSGEGGRDTTGILIATEDGDIPECNGTNKGPEPCNVCPAGAENCTYCPYGSWDGTTCDIKCSFKGINVKKVREDCKICNGSTNDSKCAQCDENELKSACEQKMLTFNTF